MPTFQMSKVRLRNGAHHPPPSQGVAEPRSSPKAGALEPKRHDQGPKRPRARGRGRARGHGGPAPLKACPVAGSRPRDCLDVLLSGRQEDGVYSVFPTHDPAGFQVYCDMRTDGGGWTVGLQLPLSLGQAGPWGGRGHPLPPFTLAGPGPSGPHKPACTGGYGRRGCRGQGPCLPVSRQLRAVLPPLCLWLPPGGKWEQREALTAGRRTGLGLSPSPRPERPHAPPSPRRPATALSPAVGPRAPYLGSRGLGPLSCGMGY